ncbi:hypothetical protein HYV88_02330 [Candidatus Woesearchaeota archaeon]|nr:hypothetical protein [Candidatus Woesearchaeota archaeon]
MSLDNIFKITKSKTIWFLGIFLYFYSIDLTIDFKELFGFLIRATIDLSTLTKISYILDPMLQAFDFLLNVLIFYILTGILIYIYENGSKRYPKLKRFFEWSKAKLTVMVVIFIIYIIFGLLGAIFWNQTIGIVFNIPATILYLNDVHIIHAIYEGLNPQRNIILPVLFWWYILASIILYIKRR